MKKNTEIYLLACELENTLINEISANEHVGSERFLADKYDVNRNLVRQALERLIDEFVVYKNEDGLVYRHINKIPICLEKYESLSTTGNKYGLDIESSLIEFSLIETNKKISKKMDVPIGTRVWKIVRLRMVKGENISIETSYIPTSIVNKLDHSLLEKQSLYNVLEEKYNLIPWYSKESIKIVNARYDESEYLEILVNEPVILKKAYVFDKENRFIEFSEDILLPEYYYFMKRGKE